MEKSYEMLVDDRELIRYDLRGMGPTRECLCGSEFWRVLARFDAEGELSLYFLDMVCVECGSIAKAPTPTPEGEVGCG